MIEEKLVLENSLHKHYLERRKNIGFKPSIEKDEGAIASFEAEKDRLEGEIKGIDAEIGLLTQEVSFTCNNIQAKTQSIYRS